MRKMNGLKWIFLGLVAAAFLTFVMGSVTLRQELARLKRTPQASPAEWRPSPFAVAPQRAINGYPQATQPQPLSPPKPAKPAWQPPPVQMLGKWQGGGAAGTGFFFFSIEIIPDTHHPNQLLGFARTVSVSMAPPALGKHQKTIAEIIAQRAPHQLALAGVASDDGSVAFHVTNAIGPQGDCPITDIRISMWGSEAIAAEWKGAACPGGSIVLARQQ